MLQNYLKITYDASSKNHRSLLREIMAKFSVMKAKHQKVNRRDPCPCTGEFGKYFDLSRKMRTNDRGHASNFRINDSIIYPYTGSSATKHSNITYNIKKIYSNSP